MGPVDMSTPEITAGVPPSLSHDELVAVQRKTLDTPRRRYSTAARLLFVLLDLIYGQCHVA